MKISYQNSGEMPEKEKLLNTLSPIAIVTDSASAIPAHLLQQYRIGVVPFYVQMGKDSYHSGVDLQPDAFFKRLRAEPELNVGTAVPPVAAFVDMYAKLAEWAKAIVSIHVAGKQSGTFNTATIASRESPIPVIVLDSETTAMGEGFVALEAAREAAQGSPLETVVEKARSMIPNVGVIALLENINYVIKGGRLSGAARAVGDFLKIQPLVRVQENRVSLSGQARRRSKGVRNLIEKIVDQVQDDPAHLTVHYAEDEAEGHSVLEKLKARLNCVEHYLTRIPIELGVHAGPGSLGVSYYVERENLNIKEQLSKLTEQAKQAILSRLPS
jgi:DegV family protein with EDD domain